MRIDTDTRSMAAPPIPQTVDRSKGPMPGIVPPRPQMHHLALPQIPFRTPPDGSLSYRPERRPAGQQDARNHTGDLRAVAEDLGERRNTGLDHLVRVR